MVNGLQTIAATIKYGEQVKDCMKYLTQNKHWDVNKDYNIDKMLYLLIDRSTYCNKNATILIWYHNGRQCHRSYKLPAFISYRQLTWYHYDEIYKNKN